MFDNVFPAGDTFYGTLRDRQSVRPARLVQNEEEHNSGTNRRKKKHRLLEIPEGMSAGQKEETLAGGGIHRGEGSSNQNLYPFSNPE